MFSPTCFETLGFILGETIVQYAVWYVLHAHTDAYKMYHIVSRSVIPVVYIKTTMD